MRNELKVLPIRLLLCALLCVPFHSSKAHQPAAPARRLCFEGERSSLLSSPLWISVAPTRVRKLRPAGGVGAMETPLAWCTAAERRREVDAGRRGRVSAGVEKCRGLGTRPG